MPDTPRRRDGFTRINLPRGQLNQRVSGLTTNIESVRENLLVPPELSELLNTQVVEMGVREDGETEEGGISLAERYWGRNRNLLEIVSSKYIVSNGLVGVEVEVEGVGRSMDDLKSKFWQVIRDGSLDSTGREFIFKSPLGGKSLNAALKSLENVFATRGILPESSLRTSTHVHLDVRDYSRLDIVNLIICYLIFERVLLNYCGTERINNPFSRPLYMTEEIVTLVASSQSRGADNLADVISNILSSGRYCAINLGSVARFGSVEFRSFRGEWRYKELVNWVNILLSLKAFADKVTDWNSVFSNISDKGGVYLMREVFPDHFESLLYGGVEEDILSGIRLSQDIVYHSELSETNSMGNAIPWSLSEEGGNKESNRFKSYKEKK